MAEEEKDKDKEDISPKKKKEVDHIIIRPWPKMVFLYPLFFMSIVFALLLTILPEGDDLKAALGVYWIIAFGANLFVMAFEFNRLRSMAIFSSLIALFVALLYIGNQYEVSFLKWASSAILSVEPMANNRFYFAVSGLLALMFLFMFLHTRFDYWEVTHNELRHHHGLLGNVERFPAPHLRFTKEINDIFEFLLMFSGTLVLFPASETRTIVLENVPHINRVERILEHLLSKLAVDIEQG